MKKGNVRVVKTALITGASRGIAVIELFRSMLFVNSYCNTKLIWTRWNKLNDIFLILVETHQLI